MRAELSALSDKVAARLRAKDLQASCIAIKVRRHDFRTFTRQVTLATPTAESRVIASQALALLDAWLADARRPKLRLLGVSTSGFSVPAQPDLFTDEGRAQNERLDAALDAIRGRYGTAAVSRASGLRRDRR
jgi:DNA polymerase-4